MKNKKPKKADKSQKGKSEKFMQYERENSPKQNGEDF